VTLLDQLRLTGRDLVLRHEKLEREAAQRVARLQAQHQQARAAEVARAAAADQAQRTTAAQQRAHLEQRFARRRDWITRAMTRSEAQRLAAIEREEGKANFTNQSGLLEAERVRFTAVQEHKSQQAAFTTARAEERTRLDQLDFKLRAALGGFRGLAQAVGTAAPPADLPTAREHPALLEQSRQQADRVARELSRINLLVLPPFFRVFRWWICLPLAVGLPAVLTPEVRRFDFAGVSLQTWLVMGGGAGGVLALYWLARWLVAPRARAASSALAGAYQLAELGAQKAEAAFQARTDEIQATFAAETQRLNDTWKQDRARVRERRSHLGDRLQQRSRQALARLASAQRAATEKLAAAETVQQSELTAQSEAALRRLDAEHESNAAQIAAGNAAARQAVAEEWQSGVLPRLAALTEAATTARRDFPAWTDPRWRELRLPAQFAGGALLGSLTVDLERLCEVKLPATGLRVPERRLTAPVQLAIPHHASLLFETRSSGQEQVIGALNNLVLRLLTSAPPGGLAFTIFDPVGLGQNFAGIMHLADFEERLINSRIWTQQAQIEQRLAELNEHIEKVTQMYLRNEYETLAAYNAQAGRLAEKYHFLVIADFPTNFSDVAVKRLQSIAASGPRCGVHLLIHWDQRKPAPVEFVAEELRKSTIGIVPRGDGLALAQAPWDGAQLSLEAPPDPETATQLLQQIGQASTDAYRVEMPFAEVVPDASEFWTLETTHELRIPIGRTGATKLQYLELGQGTRQHGLVAGKTGSGKSTLFHVLITNLSLWCSPEQVEFYLVDFKKGVEFKCYATHQLPQARVIAIESDREFGLSVLQRVDDELKRRGDLFRKLGAQNVAGYKSAGGPEPMPRVLLLIDEFQELFVSDDRVSQGAALLLDRIVRQGRAFGIHVLLGSQTLGGAYSLARATIGQMVVRIALQCNEADAYLIMNEDNPAPRLLSRPGEAIYNDDGGTLQGNSPFQVVWLADQERDEWLAKVSHHAAAKGVTARPIVFEGNAPASVRDNPLLAELLRSPATVSTAAARIWLGAPNSIKGPTEAVLRRQTGSHLLIVGQREEAALAMLGVGLIALAAQFPAGGVRLLVFDCSAPDSAEGRFLEQAVAAIPQGARIVRAGEVEVVLAGLATEQAARAEAAGATGPETFLVVHGLQRNKKLRFDEEMSFSLDTDAAANPGSQFNKLIGEGASLGFHVIATCDTYNNVMRFLSRKALSEFEMRVVFQMSANDSASLIESPQANDLGLHRAILFNGHEGWTETFRPYALPDAEWLGQAKASLQRPPA
jgi:hypothetical protein